MNFSTSVFATTSLDVGDNSVAPVDNVILNFTWSNSTNPTAGYYFNNITFTLPTNLTAIASSGSTNATNVTSFAISGQSVSFGNDSSWTTDIAAWFVFNISSISAGTYTITGTETYENVTGGTPDPGNVSTVPISIVLNINKGTPSISIYINDGQVNKTVTYPTKVNVSGNTTDTSSLPTFNLYVDTFTASSSYANLSNIELGVGTHNVVYNTSGDANWTSASNSTIYVIVDKASPSLSLAITPSTTVSFGSQTTATGSGCPSGVTCTLTRDSTTVANPETATLDAAVYTYKFETGGNANYSSASKTATLTVESKPVTAPSTSTPQITVDISGKVEVYVQKISPGSPATVSISKSDTSATEISISVKNQVNFVRVSIKKIDQLPTEVATPQGVVYKNWDVVKTNIKDADVDQATIKFSVEKSWLLDNNVDANTVALQRYNNNEWQSLATTKLSEDDSSVHYSAVSPGFSYFVISGAAAVAEEPTPPEQPPVEEPEKPPVVEQPPVQPYYIGMEVIIVIVVIAAIVGVIVYKIKKMI